MYRKSGIALMICLVLALMIAGCGGSSKSITTTTTPTPPVTNNLIVNGDFEAGKTSGQWTWNSWKSDDAINATLDFLSSVAGFTGQCLHVTSTNYGTVGSQDVQIENQYNGSHKYYDLVQGTTYTISFKAKASGAASITTLFQTSGYHWESSKSFDITTSVATYSYTYTATENASCMFLLNVGKNPANTEFWIDDVSVTPEAAATYTVKFDSQGGSSIASITNVTSGSTITKPAVDPIWSGYTFGGWYKEAACINAWNFATDTVNSDITLYAKWTQNSTVTNLLLNGDFEKGLTADSETWNAYGGTGFTKDVTTHAGLSGSCLHLTATSFSGAQLTKANSSSYAAIAYGFTAGKTYTVKFKAVADTDAQVQVVIQTPSYSWKANKTFTITSSVQQFDTLTYSPTTSESLNLIFNFSNSSANANIYLDDIELDEQ